MLVEAAVGEHPVDGAAGVPFQAGGRRVAGLLVVGVRQGQEERGGVDGAVVAAVGDLAEVGQVAVAGLVDDAAGLFAAGGVVAGALGRGLYLQTLLDEAVTR